MDSQVTSWIGAISALVGGLSGLVAAGFAIASFVVANRAKDTAKTAIAADAETREAVTIVAKAPVASGIMNADTPPVFIEPPTLEWAGRVTPPPRTPEEQERLERIVEKWLRD